MILTINNKSYTLRFGLGFLAEMNKRKSAEIEGMKTGYGAMALLATGKALGDPLALYDLIKAATAEAPQKPSNVDLESYITELAVTNQLEVVFDQIYDEIKKSPLLAYAMKIQPETQKQPQQNQDTIIHTVTA